MSVDQKQPQNNTKLHHRQFQVVARMHVSRKMVHVYSGETTCQHLPVPVHSRVMMCEGPNTCLCHNQLVGTKGKIVSLAKVTKRKMLVI